ncbi:MAG: amino acid permease [Planctomycetota bacterium]
MTEKMGLGSAVAVVTASMIGAGVYTTSGFTLLDLQSPGLVIAAWFVGGIIAICGAICYGSLVRRITESGGEYVFLARAVHPAAGMTAGWVSLLAGFTGAMAFAATTFGLYASAWLPVDPDDSAALQWLATAIVLVAAITHGSGLRRGTRVQNAVVLLKLTLIGSFLLIAYACLTDWWAWSAAPGELASAELSSSQGTETTPAPSAWSQVLAFANALTWISLSYSGFNAAVYMADVVREPRKTVPRAMVIGTLSVAVIYLLLNTVFVFAASPETVRGKQDVAMASAEALSSAIVQRGYTLGRIIEPLVRIAITLGLATSVLALMQTGPRVYRKMAADGFLPSFLAGKNNSSLPAVVLQTGLALVVIWTASLKAQLDYLGFTLSICAALCCTLVFFRPKRSAEIVDAQDNDGPPSPEDAPSRSPGGVDSSVSDQHDSRVWGYPFVPILYVGGTLLIATLTAVRVPQQASVGLATLGIGITTYVGMQFLWGSRKSGDRGD